MVVGAGGAVDRLRVGRILQRALRQLVDPLRPCCGPVSEPARKGGSQILRTKPATNHFGGYWKTERANRMPESAPNPHARQLADGVCD